MKNQDGNGYVLVEKDTDLLMTVSYIALNSFLIDKIFDKQIEEENCSNCSDDKFLL